MMWWETLPAQITMWGAALAAVLYLLKMLFGGAEFVRRLLLAMITLGETSEWPNGSKDLLSSLNSIYNKQAELGNAQATMAAAQSTLLAEVKSLSKAFEDHQLHGHR